MDSRWMFSLSPFLALALALPAQQPGAHDKLERIPPQPQQDSRGTAPGADEWRQKLTDSDLDRREKAYADLVESARGDRAVRSAIEQWAQGKDAPELAWSARLALRELRNGSPARSRGPSNSLRPGGPLDDLRSRFDELEKHFGGMDLRFDDLRSRLEEMLRNQPGAPDLQGGSTQEFQGYKLQVGPDGVTLDATEKDKDGKVETKTYKAKDMDELLQNYPELRERIGADMHFDLRGFPGADGRLPPDDLPDGNWLRNARPTQEPPTDVLGIYSSKLAPERAKALGLQPEQGLNVERVEPGTIAQVLGVRRGDTIVELNGKPIYSVDDVRKTLRSRKADEDVVVTLIGEGEQDRRTLRWSPNAPQPGPEKPRKL
jgi:hypothetical protein